MLYKFINFIKAKPIDDINLIGFINLEDEGVYEFTPMLTFVYFQYGEEYIEFESINQYSKLKVSFVHSLPTIRDKFDTVEDLFSAKSSVRNLVLIHPGAINNIVSSVTFYNLEESNESITSDSILFRLRNEQVIFLDPTFISGINVGGIEQYEFWRLNNNEKINERHVEI